MHGSSRPSKHLLECAPEPSDESLTLQVLTSILASRSEVRVPLQETEEIILCKVDLSHSPYISDLKKRNFRTIGLCSVQYVSLTALQQAPISTELILQASLAMTGSGRIGEANTACLKDSVPVTEPCLVHLLSLY
jgi:hypothetical protein